MAFYSTIIHWRNIAEFTAALVTIPRPAWCRRLCNHNTYIPNEDQWRGMASMLSMRATYIAKGWPSGPHLYLCAQSPNPSDTGIWQLTPITRPGTHAGECNTNSLGIENVGDFDRAPPSAAQYALLFAVNRLIMQHWGIPPASVVVHNECMPGRTCPGKYVTGTQIRADLNTPIPRPTTRLYTLVSPCIPLTARAPDAPLASGVVLAPGDIVQGELKPVNGWLWISDRATTKPGIGFVPISYLRLV